MICCLFFCPEDGSPQKATSQQVGVSLPGVTARVLLDRYKLDPSGGGSWKDGVLILCLTLRASPLWRGVARS